MDNFDIILFKQRKIEVWRAAKASATTDPNDLNEAVEELGKLWIG